MLSLKAAKELQKGQVLKDHVIRGLELHAYATSKSWLLYYRNRAGDRKRPRIGGFPDLTIEIARDVARQWLESIALGKDPSAEREGLLASPTVTDLASKYVAARAKRNRPNTMADIQTQLTRHILPEIGKLRVAEVTKDDIEQVLEAVRTRKHTRATHHKSQREAPIAANRARETLRGMFNLAESQSLKWRAHGTNPVKETERNKEKKRKVHITEDQFKAAFKALGDLYEAYPVHVSALLVILYAGGRVTEVLTAANHQYRDGRLELAEHKTDRTGEDRIIYLPRQAQDLIAKLPVSNNGRLFGRLDRWTVKKVWDKARDAAGLPGVTVRDFRRTFASVALSRGAVSLDQIGELFGHAHNQTTLAYAWLTDSAASEATQRTADVIEELMIEGPKKK